MDQPVIEQKADDGFSIELKGSHYYQVFKAIHDILKPRTYFEIGTRLGGTLKLANCRSLAVDPQFVVTSDIIGKKPSLQLFQQTSDSFFRDFDPTALLGGPIDLAFLDGMHLWEFLLRDFINTERYCRPNSVIVLHDCAPCDPYITTRSPSDPLRQKSKNPSWWAGDVWKVLPILKEHRPDLKIYVTDAAPTGLVFVTNLDPSSSVLSENYVNIVDRFSEVTLDSYKFGEFLEKCPLISAAEFMQFTKVARYFWI